MKFQLKQLHRNVPNRPAGYMEEVLSRATNITDTSYELSSEALAELRAKYFNKPPPQKMQGLGDAIAKVTKAMGIAGCEPCEERRRALNKLVPFKQRKL